MVLDLRLVTRCSGAEVEFVVLFVVNGAWRVDHHVAARIVFRERNEIADAVTAAKERTESIETECQPAVGRCAILKRVHQEAKLRLRLFGTEAEQVEHARLHGFVVNSNGTATDFNAIDDHIVSVGANGTGVAVDEAKVFGLG